METQLIAFVTVLLGVISTLAGLVHKGDLDRIKDRDAIIVKLETTNARLQAEADKAVQAKDSEILEWRKRAFAEIQRSAP